MQVIKAKLSDFREHYYSHKAGYNELIEFGALALILAALFIFGSLW